MKKILIFASSIIVILVSSYSVNGLTPEDVSACPIPRELFHFKVEEAKVIATSTYNNDQFLYVALHGKHDGAIDGVVPSVYKLNDQSCKEIYLDLTGDNGELSLVMPKVVALNLYEQLFISAIQEKGGVEKYKKFLKEANLNLNEDQKSVLRELLGSDL
jgi:hypothetical protein